MKNLSRFALSRRAFLATGTAAATAALLPACRGPSAATQAEGEALLDEFGWNLLRHEPTRATSLGLDTGEHAAMRSLLADSSPEGIAAYADTLRSDLDRARAFDKSALDPATRNSFEVVESAYSTALDGFALPYGDIPVGSWRTAPYAVIQNVGGYIDYPRFFDSDQPVTSEGDVQAYLSRLGQVQHVLDGELERIRAAREMGVVPPDFLLDKTIPQMEAAITSARVGDPYHGPLSRKIRETFGEERFGVSVLAAETITRDSIAPALERQLEELRLQRAEAGSSPGISAQPDGAEWYAWSLKASTTTSMSPEEIHQLGIETLADIHDRMDTLLRPLGYTEGNPGQRMTQLAQDERFQFADGDTGRAEIMAFVEERIDWIRAQMPRAFTRVVDPAIEVQRIPPNEEQGAPTAYGGAGSIDGSVPGKMWINLRSPDLHRKYDLPTLVHHETIPGHVWQGEYSNQLPLIRSILAFNAFSEGWAIYAEQLADELGAYDNNPAWRLGYLQDQAYRAVRLVVDTGMHAMGWERQRAIDYFSVNVGKGLDETTNEIDRYCSWPGQACGYMVGKLEIQRQRERAMEALGDAYDLRDFNQAVVSGGNAPLDVLAGNITRYIENTLA